MQRYLDQRFPFVSDVVAEDRQFYWSFCMNILTLNVNFQPAHKDSMQSPRKEVQKEQSSVPQRELSVQQVHKLEKSSSSKVNMLLVTSYI